MISSTFKAAGFVLFACCISVLAQNPARKTATSTISGKITLKGNGLAGISVGAREKSGQRPRPGMTATTDPQGNYRLTNVPPGTYEIMPASSRYVLTGQEAIKTLIIGEGETFEGIDFALVRGGVITGRVTDSEGRPVVEENVEISGTEGGELQGRYVNRNLFVAPTDDRGVYRFYGLPPGKYRVSAGLREDELYSGRGGHNNYKQTFHPSTTDQAKATLVEVTEGSEATNVDITLRRPQSTFRISGKVVDADTGRPIADVVYGLHKIRKDGSTSTSGLVTNSQGEFRFDNVTPGKYSVFIENSRSPEVHADPVQFEVTDQDVTNLVLKASSGNTISGVVVVDGVDEKTARSLLNGATILGQITNDPTRSRAYRPTFRMIAADGSFRLSGLPSGIIQFSVFAGNTEGRRECEVVRIERNGMVEPHVEVKDREQINGVRLTVKIHRGGIRGVVKIENGELQANQQLHVILARAGDQSFQTAVEVDARGRFSLNGLKPGLYEASVVVFHPGGHNTRPSPKQQVVITDNQVSEVTLTVDLGLKH